jgi:hypothetical protein
MGLSFSSQDKTIDALAARGALVGGDIFCDGRTAVALHNRGPRAVVALIEALGEAQGGDRLQMRTFLLCGGRMNHDGTYKSNAYRAVCKRVCEGQMIFEFARTCAVKTLNPSNNNIGIDGAAALAGMLYTNTTLESLGLYNNRIGPEGATALAGMLHTNTTLKTLNLGCNTIGNEGATALAGMICTNTTLKTLDMSFSAIGNEGATALAGMLQTNTTMETLVLHNNRIGAGEKTALREAWGGRTTNLDL